MKNRRQIRAQIEKTKGIVAKSEEQLKKETNEKVKFFIQFEIDSGKGIIRALQWVLDK